MGEFDLVFNQEHVNDVMAAVDALRKVGEKYGAISLLSAIGTAIDEFAEREGIGKDGAVEMMERLQIVQGQVWEIEGGMK